jgi:hypothetical protein
MTQASLIRQIDQIKSNTGSTHTYPEQTHQTAKAHIRAYKRIRRGLITPPRKVSCPGVKRTCLWYPHRWLAQVYPNVQTTKCKPKGFKSQGLHDQIQMIPNYFKYEHTYYHKMSTIKITPK